MQQHIHALIIEDDMDSIDILGRMVQMEGGTYKAICESDTLHPSDVDGVTVIFLDLDMPGRNGYEVFDLLRNEYGVNAPIVAYTVNTNEKATTRSIGFSGMIAKPIDATCFGERLRRIAAGETVWDDEC